MRIATFALFCLLILAAPATALTVTNDGEETVNVWIEKWLYRLRPGATTTFNPTREPAAIVIESRHWRLTCEAAGSSEIRIAERACIVDGADTGQSQFQL